MPEIISTLMEYGILLVIAAVFLWDKITISKSTVTILSRLETQAELLSKTLDGLHQSLDGLHKATENTSTALNIIQNTLALNSTKLENNSTDIERHDKRAEYMNNDIRVILDLLKNRPLSDSQTRVNNPISPSTPTFTIEN